MPDARQFDIAIVGAGIAGSALAVALRDQGLKLAIIEAQSLAPSQLPDELGLHLFDPRVSALTPRSSVLLKALGAWDAISAYRYCPYGHMTVWDAEGSGQIEFDRAEVDANELGYIVENRVLVSALLERVEAAAENVIYAGSSLQACTRLASSQMSLQLAGGEIIEANLVVAADGALSPVRQMMEFTTREWDYGHHAIVCTAQVSKGHDSTAWQSFAPGGPLALLPLPGDEEHHYCSIVWSQEEALAEDLMALEDAAFCEQLERASEARLGRILGCSKRLAFPLRQRHAVDYVQAGVALIADAAHTIHPLAGQGINLGLQDVVVLSEEILAGLARGAQPGQLDVLRRYQRRRKGENLLMMTAMDGFKHLFAQQALPIRLLRNMGMRGVNSLLPVKQQLMRHAMGLG